jgi:hypothetical protein
MWYRVAAKRRCRPPHACSREGYEFAFVMQPLKLRGFTGSTVAPTAFR